MHTTSEFVADYIDRFPFLRELLNDGLINGSALSRKITPILQEKMDKEVTESSVLMSLRRLPPKETPLKANKINQILTASKQLTVRNNICAVTYVNSPSLTGAQNEFLAMIISNPNPFYNLSRGSSETTIMFNEVHLGIHANCFEGEQEKAVRKNLSALSLKLPDENRDVAGVYYFLIRKLSWAGINLVELVSTSNEFIILVDEKQVNDAFELLMSK